MKSDLGIRKKLLAFFILVLASLSYSTLTYSQESQAPVDLKEQIKAELYKEIKESLYKEIYSEIESIVKEEVKKELQIYLANQKNGNLENTSDDLAKNTESIQAAVKQTIRDIFSSSENYRDMLSDEQLDAIVAGYGIESELKIARGITKSHLDQPAFRLAKNDTGAVSSMTADDYELVAGDAERAESIERTLQQKGSILLPKGKLQFEPSFSWSHFSSNRINIDGFSILDTLTIGTINVERVKRDVFIQTFAFKYGLINNLQAEFKVPFRGQYDRDLLQSANGSTTAESTSGSAGMGDIEIGLSRQIGWEEGLMPDLIASINLKTPTGRSPYNKTIGLGTGHWAARAALIAAKSSDPAVIFGSINYTHNFEESVTNIGDVKPGDSIGYSLGMAIALSYQVALNFSFDHTLAEKLQINGRRSSGSFLNSANVRIGANWAINEQSSVDFGVSFGVTDDAPDVTVDLRFPYLF